MENDANELMRRRYEAGQVFSPAAPIDARELFAGRFRQLQTLVDVVSQRGQHAIVFGERGVGKTSLVNVLAGHLPVERSSLIVSRCNCDSGDTFASVWRKVFLRIPVLNQEQTLGFRPAVATTVQSVADELTQEPTPDFVARALREIGAGNTVVVIIDEFDRLLGTADNRLFADTIKMLSDYAVSATLILVGVADNVCDLIAGHQSIERALVQVHMPRMSREEVREIVRQRLPTLNLTIQPQVMEEICVLARGLPHYVHLIALATARCAISSGANEIAHSHLLAGIEEAIANANQSILALVNKATTSPHKDNLYFQTALACAMTDTDDLGYFAAGDVREPFNQVVIDRSYPVSAFSKQLHELCSPERGPLLQKTGQKHRHRFRFTNPLLQPFLLMRGVMAGVISPPQLGEMT